MTKDNSVGAKNGYWSSNDERDTLLKREHEEEKCNAFSDWEGSRITLSFNSFWFDFYNCGYNKPISNYYFDLPIDQAKALRDKLDIAIADYEGLDKSVEEYFRKQKENELRPSEQ